MRRITLAVAFGFSSATVAMVAVPEGGDYADTKAVVVQWAETQNLVSQEWNQWKREEAILEDLARMLETEKEDLAQKIEASKESATEADKRRAEIVERRNDLEAASSVIRSNIESLEDRVRDLAPSFPDSYKKSVGPLLRQLPGKGQPTQLSLSVRLRNVIGILSQANKFDNTLSIETETRSFADGRSKQVDTVYLGMAIAYYADAAGEEAGYGYPTKEGWKWEATPEYGKAIRDAISMYQKGKQAEFVTLPVFIK